MKVNKFPFILSACVAGCMMAFTACGGSDKEKSSDADIDDKDYYGEEVTFENTQKEEPVKVDSAALRAIIGPDRALENLHGNVREVITYNGIRYDTITFDIDGYYLLKETPFTTNRMFFPDSTKIGKSTLQHPESEDGSTIVIDRDDNGYLHEMAEYNSEYSSPLIHMTFQWADGKVAEKSLKRWYSGPTSTYSYNDNGDLISETTQENPSGAMITEEITYTILVTDEFGNWTERKAVNHSTFYNAYQDTETTDTTTKIEKRQIIYY